MSKNTEKTITIEITYRDVNEAMTFIRDFRKDLFFVHEFKQHVHSVFVNVVNSQFNEPSFDYPTPRHETINGVQCVVYPSRMNDDDE